MKKTAAECFGENIRRLREERGLTQEAFSARAGLSLGFFQQVERGKKWVGPKTITAIARALLVYESDLFRDCDRDPEPDVKLLLSQFCRALGIELPAGAIEAATVRLPPAAYAQLYDSMPDVICLELTELSQRPGWDWERFRKGLKR